MAELNDAYKQLRTEDRRRVYDRLGAAAAPTQTERAQPQHKPAGAPPHGGKRGVPDFGRYAGCSLAKLATHDPVYLRWLSRHSSGIRYRLEIAELLDTPTKSRADAPKTERR